ncbi:hypothetical protein C8R47DRAFT_740797 [Mycena vitilis]|nr:hypothetical protein C8R47DRAFT_740797 [Mycena vitilis]
MAGAAPDVRSLAGICRLPPGLQLCAHLDNHWTEGGLYVDEGAGAVYCCGRVLTTTLTDFRAGAIPRGALLAELEIKYGYATDFDHRRGAYSRCERGDWTYLWFWVFYTDYRIVAGEFCASSRVQSEHLVAQNESITSCSWTTELLACAVSATAASSTTANFGAMKMWGILAVF